MSLTSTEVFMKTLSQSITDYLLDSVNIFGILHHSVW